MNYKSLKILEFDKVKRSLKEYANTDAARDIIEMLQPYSNIYEAENHLEETDEAFRLLIIKGNPPFEGVCDVRVGITMAKKGSVLTPVQILRIGAVLRSSRRFKKYIEHDENEKPFRIIEDICSGITEFKTLEKKIFESIENENEVSDRASSKLYNIRRSLRNKNSSIRDKVGSLVRGYSKYLQDSLYTMRGERYVLPVRAEYKSYVPGLVHDQSSSGATLYIEPMGLVNLNNEIKQLMLEEKNEIDRILSELSGEIYDDISAIEVNSRILWELDFIFAKARFAGDGNCTIPKISESGIVNIIQGRHPLIEIKKAVPMDLHMGDKFKSLVITGPNTGGKTVTLKTIGLLHIMALSGLMIPASQNSQVGFFTEIFADIGDEQSIEQSLSTFSSHMTNIVDIIEKADEKSLVLFDELGAGTDPTEGAALAVSILETLKRRNASIVATTHYSELKVYALKTEGVENASVEFDIKTLRPTYRLIVGAPGKSNAFEISKRLGLPDFVIENARLNISSDALKFEDLIQNLQDKNLEAEKYMRDARNLKIETEKFKERYEEKYKKFQNTRENAVIEARREARNIIRNTKQEADTILKEMRKLEETGLKSDVRRKLEMQRKSIGEKLEEAENKLYSHKNKTGRGQVKNVEGGEEVFLPQLNQNVIVLTKPDARGGLKVQAGIMKIDVNIKDLEMPKATLGKQKKSEKRALKLNMKSVSNSVDLRGMDSIEAVYTTDKYIDDAYMGGLKEVTIIHGKGTGILRNSINEMLKRNSHVKSYRLGEYGEGGTGVTVAQLK